LLVLFDILPRIFYQAHKKLEQTKTLFLHFDWDVVSDICTSIKTRIAANSFDVAVFIHLFRFIPSKFVRITKLHTHTPSLPILLDLSCKVHGSCISSCDSNIMHSSKITQIYQKKTHILLPFLVHFIYCSLHFQTPVQLFRPEVR